MYYVYITTNLINGKKYIGVSNNKNVYYKTYYIGSGKLLKLAIQKYGRKNFKKEIIKEFNDEIHSREYEKVLIEQYDAVNNELFYNLCEGGYGGSQKGHNVSALTKEKISNKLKGRIITEESKKKISNKLKGKSFKSKEALKICSDKKKLFWINLNEIDRDIISKKMSEKHKGKVVSVETGIKIAKLKPEDIFNIFNLYEIGKTHKELSIMFNINISSIYDILNKKSYKWVWS